ncbi:MAG: lysophospholipid acyltransferase family protein [Chthonomonadales bacterium]|nr:lysophospholipid acyltransferase family protein [Chthonomonadales bacterium]
MAEGPNAPESPPRGPPSPRPPRKPAVIGLIVWALARFIGLTLRVRYIGRERMEEAARKGCILVTWHGRTLIAANTLRGRGFWALISLSRDGEIQNHIFRRFGFQTIRGSTGRGGVRAALQLARAVQEGGVLAFTPDGPRGPTHRVQEGTIFLAQRSGKPIVPIGCSARPRKLMGSWDSYMVPLPFARAEVVFGPPIAVPAELTEEGRRAAAEQVERALNDCERQAEEALGFDYAAPRPTNPVP